MSDGLDPILEADLVAYVDDQLKPARRVEVAAHLAAHPALAARVMADLRDRDELRLALTAEGGAAAPAPRTVEAARRLARALQRRRTGTRLGRVAALGLFVAIGWFAHQEAGPLGIRQSAATAQPPAFVTDAFRAHRTQALRAGMASQREARAYDPAEIRSATAIGMPALPAGWQVADVQIFPSDFGPSVEVLVRAPDLGALSLFAARPGRFDVAEPAAISDGGETAAFWQIGEVAYALVAEGRDRKRLEETAADLARTLY